MLQMIRSSLWDEPLFGIVTVLFSPAEVAGLAVMGLWCMRPPKQKQPFAKKRLPRVLEHVHVDVDVKVTKRNINRNE